VKHGVFVAGRSDERATKNEIDETLCRSSESLRIVNVYEDIGHREELPHVLPVGVLRLSLIALDELFSTFTKLVCPTGVVRSGNLLGETIDAASMRRVRSDQEEGPAVDPP